MHVAPRILSNFVTLFVAIGLVETAVAFANLTAGLHRSQRRSLAVRSVTITGLSCCRSRSTALVLSLLYVSLPAFCATGEDLYAALTAPFDAIGMALEGLNRHRDEPADRIGFNVMELASSLLLSSVLPVFVDRYPGIAVDIIGLERGFRADALRLDLDCVRSHAGQHTQPDRVGSASDARGGGSGDLDLRAIRAVHLCSPLSRRGDAALMYSTY